MSKKSSPKSNHPGRGGDAAVRATDAPRVSFAGSLGYRFDGDKVELNVELALSGALSKGRYLLELVAQEVRASESTMHAERSVARVALDLPTPLGPITHPVNVMTSAKIPPAGSYYSMALRLVHETPSGAPAILDRAHFTLHETFPAPRFVGSVSYQLEGTDVVFEVDRLESARSPSNLSGTLSLELRAATSQTELEEGGGIALAAFSLAPLSGGYFVGPMLCRTKLQRRIDAGQRLYVVLREFTGDGYATRDYREVAANDVRPGQVERPREKHAPVAHQVSVGHASLEELTQVEGITLKIAKEIIKARPFGSLSDLLRVKGLGQRTLDKLRGRITL